MVVPALAALYSILAWIFSIQFSILRYPPQYPLSIRHFIQLVSIPASGISLLSGLASIHSTGISVSGQASIQLSASSSQHPVSPASIPRTSICHSSMSQPMFDNILSLVLYPYMLAS